MAAKQGLAQNKTAIAGIAIVGVLVIVAVMVNSKSTDLQNQRYFYDLETGALFPGDRRAMPPIDAPSGAGHGVGAVVLGCGGCGDSASLKPAWLEKYTDKARQAEAKLASADPATTDPAAMMAELQAGHLVAAPPEDGAEPQWFAMDSPQGVQLRGEQTEAACSDGSKPELCLP